MVRERWITLLTIAAGIVAGHFVGSPRTMTAASTRQGPQIVRTVAAASAAAQAAQAATGRRPNILVIWGDDVGVHNISAYNMGIMGYKTPNIDRIAREGAIFTDAYAQQKLHGRPRVVHPGPAPVPHRPADHRYAGFRTRNP